MRKPSLVARMETRPADARRGTKGGNLQTFLNSYIKMASGNLWDVVSQPWIAFQGKAPPGE
jgi:hypothetical protein